MKKIFITQLQAGQQVVDIFYIARSSLHETKHGKPYLALGLMDKSGDIEARLWENAESFEAVAKEGAFVRIEAVVKSFRDQLQLSLTNLEAVEPQAVSLTDFMAASLRSSEEMAAELQALITQVRDKGLRSLLRHIFQGQVLERFVNAPAAKKMHHAYLGGLIEHTLSMARMAKLAAAHYPIIDQDMLLAGALLHDLAKIDEFDCSGPAFSYTNRGRLVGHLVLGVEMLRRAADKVKDLAAERVDQLAHLILSHHGQLEFGSPVLPMTPEAILLHHLDDMDAKMNYLEGLRAKLPGSEWQWTEFQRPLQRFLYLRGVDETEAAAIEEDDEAALEALRQRQQRLF